MASNKLRAASQDHGEAAEMDMSPMIDMVFLLLLFFLVVSNPKTIKIDAEVKPPVAKYGGCLLYTSPSPRDQRGSRMPSSA